MSHPSILSIIVIGWVFVLGAFIWSGVRTKKRLKGASLAQLFAAQSDQVGKSYSEWRLPSELDVPTPRSIRTVRLGRYLSRKLPQIISFLVIAIGIYGFAFLLFHGMSVLGMFHAFLEFLKDPKWRGWMILPSAVCGAIALRFVASGYARRRKEQRLLKWGTPARAVATAQFWGRGVTFHEFEYLDAAGNLMRGRDQHARMPRGGKEVMTVLYDPDRPSEFMSYPGTYYEIGGHNM
jgi:hypothetical protein